MPFISAESALFLISSLLTLALSFLNVSISTLLKVTALLLVVLLFILNHYFFSKSRPIPTDRLRYALIFLSSFIIQLLVYTTGGFYSPFIILFHLYVITCTIILNLRASLSFFIFSFGILVANVALDQNTLISFKQDPWSFILYGVSFIAVVPLSQVLVRHYNLKDSLTKFLLTQVKLKEKQIQLEELRRQSIIESLEDLVLVTDKNLKILSINEAAKNTVRLTKGEALGRAVLDLLIFRTEGGSTVDEASLLVEKAIREKKPQLIPGLLLYATNTTPPHKVKLRIQPIIDLEGNLDQVTFVVSQEGETESRTQRISLEKAQTQHEAMIEQFKQKLLQAGLSALKDQVDLLGKAEQDLILALRLENESFKPKKVLRNIDTLCEQVVKSEQNFAQNFQVGLEIIMPTKTSNYLHLPSPFFIAPMDVKWFEILLEKILEISILLSSGNIGSKVRVSFDHVGKRIDIKTTFSFRGLNESEQKDLFVEYYGDLNEKTNLGLGSGLEGYLIKRVATMLNLPLGLIFDKAKNELSFILRVPREAS